jgi:hypothetical protein
MYLGKIVNASSHVDYMCQIYCPGETEHTPAPDDYGLSSFVAVEQPTGGYLVGLIVNTMLVNPEFGSLGPRLSPQEDLAVFSPDYLAEKATLVAIIAIGVVNDGAATQGVPLVATSIDAQVRPLTDDEIAHFHHGEGRFQLAYLPLLLAMSASPLLPPLLQRLMDQLTRRFPAEAGHLAILQRNLAWRAAVLPAG